MYIEFLLEKKKNLLLLLQTFTGPFTYYYNDGQPMLYIIFGVDYFIRLPFLR